MQIIKKFAAVWGVLAVALIFSQGCTSSSGSSSSGSGSISRIQVIPAAASLQASQKSDVVDSSGNTTTQYTWSSTFVTVIVRDSGGNRVPAGTSVTIACGAGYLGDNPSVTDPVSSITLTTDANGQVQVKYTAGFTTGTASISATSQGNYGSATITIV